jgi:hypothetical protein
MNPRLKLVGLSPEMEPWLRTNSLHSRMDKNSCHDRQVSRRNLAPSWSLNGRSASDVHRGVPVSVTQIAACAAPKDGTPSDSPAAASGVLAAGASRVDRDDKSAVLARHGFERCSKSAVRQPLGLAVTLLSPTSMIQVLQIFNRDERVVFLREFEYLMGDLFTSRLCEMPFFLAELSQGVSGISAPFRSMREEFRAPQRDVSLPVADVLAEVELLQDLPALVENGDSGEPLHPHIHAQNRVILPSEKFGLIVVLHGHKDLAGAESECGSSPTIFRRPHEPPVRPVDRNRYGDSSLQSSEGDDGVAPFGLYNVSRARYVVWDIDPVYNTTVLQYRRGVSEKRTGNHAGDSEFPDPFVERLLKGNLVSLLLLLDHEGEGLSVSRRQFTKQLPLASARRKKIQDERLLNDSVQFQRPQNGPGDLHITPHASFAPLTSGECRIPLRGM